MQTKKQICLVDDHVIVRSGLKELIEKIGPYEVANEFDNGKEFLEFLSSSPQPDLIILDINMPEMNGEQVMEWCNEKKVSIPILILTFSSEEDKIIKLFRLGVRGYLQKNCTSLVMRSALEAIFSIGYYHNEFLVYSLQTTAAPARKTEKDLILEQLKDREKEFLKYVCHEKEYTYGQIADLMNVQPRTIDGYREAIFEKFGIKSKTGLVLFILRHQLFEQL
jgi:DNA-binding NarL/FixJ family response regulator